MKNSSERERDVHFGQTMRTLRTALGLTQRGLAGHLGVSRQTVAKWEAGLKYPKVASLKQIIALGVQRQIFPVGSQRKDIRALWQTAHQKERLDEHWLQALLGQQRPQLTLVTPQYVEQAHLGEQTPAPPILGPRIDWGEAHVASSFYGREQEMARLSQWVKQEHCRLVSVLGMGGIGKSALVVKLMHSLASHFDVVIFRSLRNAPPCELLLDDCLQVLSPQLGIVPANLERRLSLLIESLQQMRVLVVLDNLETLLKEREATGRLRPGYEGYRCLLRRVGEAKHQSCLLLSSREKPAELELRRLEGKHAPVRSLRLGGLSTAACEQMFAEQKLVGTPQEQAHLAGVYAGNPLALKIVAQTITELFSGEISPFLSEGRVIFGSITDLLDEQFSRLSPLEQAVLCCLAIVREPVTLEELRSMLTTPLQQGQLLEAIESLHRRSLLECGQRPASFTLQAAMLEYVTTVLVKETTHEIQQR